ncbi:hypothetical protein BBJ28_00026821 [Nothophytophthora sp. Chile5]|nr:hypothetical protein BBJ28_00026821 [Nothophytophthora sp. Chile5]
MAGEGGSSKVMPSPATAPKKGPGRKKAARASAKDQATSVVACNSLTLPEMKVNALESSRHLEKRFTFLWTTALSLLPTNAPVANHMVYVALHHSVLPSLHRFPMLIRSMNPFIVRFKQCDDDAIGSFESRGAATSVKALTSTTREGPEASAPASKRLKPDSEAEGQRGESEPAVSVVAPAGSQPREAPNLQQDMKTAASMFAPPPSPPRKLLDGPKTRKKKKKKAQPDAAVVAVKSSLSSFLQSLQPSSRK